MPAEPSDTGATTSTGRPPGASGEHLPLRSSCNGGSALTGRQGPDRPHHRHAEDAAMRHALEIARGDLLPAGLGPRVGCVLLAPDGTIVGQGRSNRVSGVHAEIAALADAGAEARGSTAVLTLEPCVGPSDGRSDRGDSADSGPGASCARAIVDAGIRKVVLAQACPGTTTRPGTEVLRAAGLEVVEVSGTVADDARALNRPWTFGARARRPLVTWVVDQGSGSPATDLAALRSAADTLVVSTWAVVGHDVSLAVLDPDGRPAARQPLRVVMGTRELDPDLPVFDGPGRTLHFATRDPHLALEAIYDLGGRHVLLAGGPALAAEFLRAGVVDEIVTHVEPELTVDGVVGALDLGVGRLPADTGLHDVRVVEDVTGRTFLRVTLVPETSPLHGLG